MSRYHKTITPKYYLPDLIDKCIDQALDELREKYSNVRLVNVTSFAVFGEIYIIVIADAEPKAQEAIRYDALTVPEMLAVPEKELPSINAALRQRLQERSERHG